MSQDETPSPPAEEPLLWETEAPDGAVRQMTLDQLNDEFQAGRVVETTRVRKPGATEWTTIELLLKETGPRSLKPIPPSVEAVGAPLPDVEIFRKRPRPVLGPALSLLAVSLWAYVVIGAFTTSWVSGGAPLREGIAFELVALAVLVAWFLAVRRSRAVPMHGTRGVIMRSALVGLVAFALWGLIVVLATLMGNASAKNVDGIVMACLRIVAGVAAFAGHRLTRHPRPEATRARRSAIVFAWMGVAMLTLWACVVMGQE